MDLEAMPNSWNEIQAIMLHKKGYVNDPSNYRCISLVNNLTKIFT